MTAIRISSNAQGNSFEVTLSGHADYNPGNDIVCAGISTITYTLLNYLLWARDNYLIKHLEYKDNPGDIKIRATRYAPYDREISTALNMFRIGAEMMASYYPDNIKVEVTYQ